MSIYKEAADLIEKYGWIQGQAGSFRVGFCLYGALWHAAIRKGHKIIGLEEDITISTISPSMDAIEYLVGEDPIAWNDKIDRTQDEVIKVLLRADANV